jgi:hypothetical protein
MQKQYSNKEKPNHRATQQQAAGKNLNQKFSMDLSQTVIRSWCANPDSCLTDCKTYCKQLKPTK